MIFKFPKKSLLRYLQVPQNIIETNSKYNMNGNMNRVPPSESTTKDSLSKADQLKTPAVSMKMPKKKESKKKQPMKKVPKKKKPRTYHNHFSYEDYEAEILQSEEYQFAFFADDDCANMMLQNAFAIDDDDDIQVVKSNKKQDEDNGWVFV